MDNKHKILITGGTGLVGYALKQISKNYESVYDFVFLSSKDANLCNYEETIDVFKKIKPSVVIHLAANVGGLFKNMEHQVEMFEHNVKINMNVVNCAFHFGVKHFIGCLSTCIFPDKITYPICENELHNGEPHVSNYGYAFAKRMLEVQIRTYREQYGVNYMCITPCNIYGENDNFSLENGHVIPSLIHKCWLAKQKNELFVCKGSGKPLRQFIYSADLAHIIMVILQKSFMEIQLPHNIIVSVSEKEEVSISYVAHLIARAFDYEHNLVFDNMSADGQYKKTVSNEKLMELLDDTHFSFTKIEDGINETVAWFEMQKIENIQNLRL